MKMAKFLTRQYIFYVSVRPRLAVNLFWPVDMSILIIWMSIFLVLGLPGGCFHLSCICIEITVSKLSRLWSDVARCGVWSGPALFAYRNTPRRVAGLKRVKTSITIIRFSPTTANRGENSAIHVFLCCTEVLDWPQSFCFNWIYL